ncbi:unnamed protein product [Fraxinus pennsylvanica]|uniref:Cytochrome b561 domain-containing protein n=1 Tax=Fraxinus pennsylvanica TaxID=56036 RepID=A0AAD1YU71_9LAMI|nr:unnamed protein product [Fraxinus pennsylvanica]
MPFAIPAGIALLNLLPSVCSSQDRAEIYNKHASNKHKIHEMNPQLLFEIKLHGFLFWASFGFLTPIGILVMRKSNGEESILAVLLATVGAVLSMKYLDNSFNNLHQRIGIALYGGIWLQALIGILRPHRERKGRSTWYIFHWLLGITVSFLGLINNMCPNVRMVEKTSKSARIWTIIFTAQISVMIFLYLLQEKKNYIQKHGVILAVQSNDQDLAPRNKQKETPAQNC